MNKINTDLKLEKENMQRWLQKAAREDFAAKLGAKNWILEPGFCSCELSVKSRHTNLNKVLHGGVIYSIADTGMGGALSASLKKNEVCATVEMKINYLASVTRGIIRQKTRMIHRGRRIAVFVSEIKDGNGRLIALATGTFAIMKQRNQDSRPKTKDKKQK